MAGNDKESKDVGRAAENIREALERETASNEARYAEIANSIPSEYEYKEGENVVRFEIETIDPKRAAELLEGSDWDPNELEPTASKEKPSGYQHGFTKAADVKIIRDYADRMRQNQWLINGYPIIIDNGGELLDGRKRLKACIEAGVSFKTFVAYGIDKSAEITIDQHAPRDYKATLKSYGVVEHAEKVQQLLSRLIRIQRGNYGISSDRIDWPTYDAVFTAHEHDLKFAIEWSLERANKVVSQRAMPVLAFMAKKAGHLDLLEQLIDEGIAFQKGSALPSTMAFTASTWVTALVNRKGGLEKDTDALSEIALTIMYMNDLIDHSPARLHTWVRPTISSRKNQETGEVERNLGLPDLKGYPGVPEALEQPKDDAHRLHLTELLQRGKDKENPDTIKSTELWITPEIAADWMLRFNTDNRNIQPRQIKALKSDIENGRWSFNAQPICFEGSPFQSGPNEKTRLLNGQHRLRAIAEVGQPVRAMVVTGLSEENFSTYDTTRRATRSYGEKDIDDRVAAVVARLLHFERKGELTLEKPDPEGRVFPSYTLTVPETDQIINEHPDLVVCSQDVRRFSLDAAMKDCAADSISIFIFYRALREARQLGREEIAREFIDRLVFRKKLVEPQGERAPRKQHREVMDRLKSAGEDDAARLMKESLKIHIDLRARERELGRREQGAHQDLVSLYKIWRRFLAMRLGKATEDLPPFVVETSKAAT